MVGDDDVDAALVRPRRSRPARRPAVDRDDERRTRRHRRVDGRERQAVALVEPARDVRHDRDAEPTQGEGQDRQAGQAVGIEVAEDQDALAAVAGAPSAGRAAARRRAGAAGRGGRRAARANQAASSVGLTTPRPARSPASRSGRHAVPAARRGPAGSRIRRSGKIQRKRGSTTASGCHEGASPRASPTGCVAGLRTPCAGPRARGSRSGDRAGGRPRAASRRAAGRRRRSTSRSPTRSR